MKTVCIVCVAILLSLSCSKNSSEAGDKDPPVIQIISPADNHVFLAGQTIQTFADVTDNVKVSELHIHINDNSNGIRLRDIHAYPDNKNGTIQDSFPAQAGMSYNIKIIAYDPEYNMATAEVNVTVN